MVRTHMDLINPKLIQEDLHDSRHEIRSLIMQDLLRKAEVTEYVCKCLCHILSGMLFQRNRLRVVRTDIKDCEDESVASVLANRQWANDVNSDLTKWF